MKPGWPPEKVAPIATKSTGPCDLSPVHAIGKQPKGRDIGEVGEIETPRPVVAALERYAHWTPLGIDPVFVCSKRRRDIIVDAIDVEVQLVLAATDHGIDRDRDGLARQRPLQMRFHVGARAPQAPAK